MKGKILIILMVLLVLAFVIEANTSIKSGRGFISQALMSLVRR